MLTIIGIDPGLTGAVAVMGPTGLFVEDLPMVGKRLDARRLHRFLEAHKPHAIVVEDVELRPRQAGVKTMVSNFGRIMACAELVSGVSTMVIASKAWQAGMDLPKDRKERLRAYTRMASVRWPLLQFSGPRGGLLDGRAAACWIAASVSSGIAKAYDDIEKTESPSERPGNGPSVDAVDHYYGGGVE